MNIHPNFIVDKDGNKTAVILSFDEWEAIVTELNGYSLPYTKNKDEGAVIIDQWFDTAFNALLKGYRKRKELIERK